jgi:hypothetical protein
MLWRSTPAWPASRARKGPCDPDPREPASTVIWVFYVLFLAGAFSGGVGVMRAAYLRHHEDEQP